MFDIDVKLYPSLFSKNKNVGLSFVSNALFEHQVIASKGSSVGIVTLLTPCESSITPFNLLVGTFKKSFKISFVIFEYVSE